MARTTITIDSATSTANCPPIRRKRRKGSPTSKKTTSKSMTTKSTARKSGKKPAAKRRPKKTAARSQKTAAVRRPASKVTKKRSASRVTFGGLFAATGRDRTLVRTRAAKRQLLADDHTAVHSTQLSDRQFTSTQLRRVETLNMAFKRLDSTLPFALRAYCSHNDAGFVLRRFTPSCAPSDNGSFSTDDLAKQRPSTIARKDINKILTKHVGMTITDIEKASPDDVHASAVATQSNRKPKTKKSATLKTSPTTSATTETKNDPAEKKPASSPRPKRKVTTRASTRATTTPKQPAPSVTPASQSSTPESSSDDLGAIETQLASLEKLLTGAIASKSASTVADGTYTHRVKGRRVVVKDRPEGMWTDEGTEIMPYTLVDIVDGKKVTSWIEYLDGEYFNIERVGEAGRKLFATSAEKAKESDYQQYSKEHTDVTKVMRIPVRAVVDTNEREWERRYSEWAKAGRPHDIHGNADPSYFF
jgi:hypothetical protein